MMCQVLLFIAALIGAVSMAFATNNVRIDVIEYNKMRMIYTDPDHYAIYNPDFKNNWLAISHNSQSANILGRDTKITAKKWSALTKSEMDEAEASKTFLNNIRWKGISSVKGDFVRISSYDQFGSLTSSSSGGSASSASSSSMSVNGMSVSRTGDNNYVIARDDLPFNWIRLFIDDKIVGTVKRDGQVFYNHIDSLSSDERTKLNEIMDQIKTMNQAQDSMIKSMSNPFDFVAKAMSGMFGR